MRELKANQIIRDAAMRKGVFLYQVGERFGYKYPEQWSRRLRTELSQEDQEKALRCIDQIVREREQA